MAIVVTRQKESTTGKTGDVPYHAYDLSLTPGTPLTEAAAVAAVAAQGLIDQGDDAQDYTFNRVSYNSVIITLRYWDTELRPLPAPKLTPPATGSISWGFNAVSFQPQHKTYSLGNIWRQSGAPDFKGMVNVQEWSNSFIQSKPYAGYNLELPPETDTLQYIIPNGDFTVSFRQKIRDCLYHVHEGAATFFGTASGNMMLVRAQAHQRTNSDLTLDLGFSHRPAGDRYVGDVSVSSRGGPSVAGHDLVWAVFFEEFVSLGGGINVRRPYPKWLYIEKVWERYDFNTLGLPGSSS